ncbi:ZIP family metal transporter [Jatrophihabitans sp. YIM 134969]
MSLSTTLLLGLIAGVTIVLGLPVGRMRRPAPTLRVVLNATAVGVLLFLLWDVLSAAWEPLDNALGATHEGTGGWGPVAGYGALFAGGLAVGLLALVAYDRRMARATSSRNAGGPGAMAVSERPAARGVASWSPAKRTSLLIAVGIGLHNFAEGLAIGQAAAGGAIALAVVLVVGFAVHNATEGFGIVAPLAASRGDAGTVEPLPGWGFLLAMAAIGGGPTFLGTAVGYQFTSEPVSVVFLTLAAGSIVYVIAQLLGVAARARRADLVAYGLLIGMLAGFATDAIVTAGGV